MLAVGQRMGRHRRYSGSYGYTNWRAYHASKVAVLEGKFGPVLDEVKRRFLSMESWLLDALFSDYAFLHGDGAGRYARKTYAEWRSGRTMMSGQTAERLIDLVPKFLPGKDRLDLVGLLRKHYFPRSTATLRCDLETWEPQLLAIVTAMVEKSHTASIPEDLFRSATWLAGDDAKEAQRLLAEAEDLEARVRLGYLRAEMARIRAAVSALEGGKTTEVSHRIEIPQGSVDLHISHKPKGFLSRLFKNGATTMADDKIIPHESGSVRRDLLAPGPRSENLLDAAARNLSEADSKALAAKAVDAKLQVDRAQAEADDRFRNSTRDMATTVRMVDELDKQKADYDINSEFNTASGQTRIKVKRATNFSILVIAIVIGIVLVLALRK